MHVVDISINAAIIIKPDHLATAREPLALIYNNNYSNGKDGASLQL